MLRVFFVAVNVTALIAALLYFGRSGSAAAPPVRDRGSSAKVRAEMRREAKAASARTAPTWHGGYAAYKHDKTIYYRWVRTRHIKVITRDGCSLLAVTAYELYNHTSIGDLIGSRANVPPRTPVLVKLVGTSGPTKTAVSAPTINCY